MIGKIVNFMITYAIELIATWLAVLSIYGEWVVNHRTAYGWICCIIWIYCRNSIKDRGE